MEAEASGWVKVLLNFFSLDKPFFVLSEEAENRDSAYFLLLNWAEVVRQPVLKAREPQSERECGD